MNVNDPELKMQMARLIPEHLVILSPDRICWQATNVPVLETEWLYVMHLVEQQIDRTKNIINPDYGHTTTWHAYLLELQQTVGRGRAEEIVSASFNHRAIARRNLGWSQE